MRQRNYVVDIIENATPSVITTKIMTATEVLEMVKVDMEKGLVGPATLTAMAGNYHTGSANVIYSLLAESA